MALLRWDPFTLLTRLDDQFDDVVRRTFGSAPLQFVPPVEMATDDSDVVLTLEVPGVDVSEIDIQVEDGRLTVTGERKDRWENSRGQVLVRELRYGSFRRTFQLPEGVTADQIEAEADRGLLRIRVRNVTKPVSPPAKIQVKSGQAAQTKTIESRPTEQPAKS
jgi:HSP20 family protein